MADSVYFVGRIFADKSYPVCRCGVFVGKAPIAVADEHEMPVFEFVQAVAVYLKVHGEKRFPDHLKFVHIGVGMADFKVLDSDIFAVFNGDIRHLAVYDKN